MDFHSRTLKTPHKQRIIIEIDILGDEVDLDKYQKIADRLTDLLCQDSWLSNPPKKLTFNTKVSLQLLPQKSHNQVQLPCVNSNERVTNEIAQRNYSNPESVMKKEDLKICLNIAVVKVPSVVNKSSVRFHQ